MAGGVRIRPRPGTAASEDPPMCDNSVMESTNVLLFYISLMGLPHLFIVLTSASVPSKIGISFLVIYKMQSSLRHFHKHLLILIFVLRFHPIAQEYPWPNSNPSNLAFWAVLK